MDVDESLEQLADTFGPQGPVGCVLSSEIPRPRWIALLVLETVEKQFHRAFVVFGGVTDYVWFPWGLPGRAESGYGCSLRYELIPEKDYPELEQRMAIFHTGHTRASKDVNAVWTKKLATKAGHALHQRKLELAYRFREGLRKRDWEAAISATEEYRQVRTCLCPAYMTRAGKIHRSACRHGGTAFSTGPSGGVLALCPEPIGLKQTRANLRQSQSGILFRVRAKGHESDEPLNKAGDK